MDKSKYYNQRNKANVRVKETKHSQNAKANRSFGSGKTIGSILSEDLLNS